MPFATSRKRLAIILVFVALPLLGGCYGWGPHHDGWGGHHGRYDHGEMHGRYRGQPCPQGDDERADSDRPCPYR